jgi:hypothetical protein
MDDIDKLDKIWAHSLKLSTWTKIDHLDKIWTSIHYGEKKIGTKWMKSIYIWMDTSETHERAWFYFIFCEKTLQFQNTCNPILRIDTPLFRVSCKGVTGHSKKSIEAPPALVHWQYFCSVSQHLGNLGINMSNN